MLNLTLACGHYDRTEALRDGRVQPDGIKLNCLTLKVEETFWRMMQYREFDVAETSLGGYVVRRGRAVEDLVAIPVFPSRFFRQSCIFIHSNSGIETPQDLKGKRIGVPEYQMTAAVWARGTLSDDYDVRAEDIEWVQGGLEDPGRLPFEPVEPTGIRLSFAPTGRSLAQMLAAGEIHALITARTPSTFNPVQSTVCRLFQEPWKVERDYFNRTGIFPIMHTVSIRQEILEEHPWVAATLMKAFSDAKDLAIADLTQTSALPLTLPFLTEHAHETVEAMGEDFWPYGLEANRKTLETFVRYMNEQGMIGHQMPIEDLFAPSTHRTFRI